ncbi:MAG: flagellin [Pseudomonadota bacterium]
MLPPLSNNLDQTQSAVQTTSQRLSSGTRVTAQSDPAASSIVTLFAAQLVGNQQAQNNVGDAVSLTDTASAGLSQVSESLQQIRQLTVQAANGTNSASDVQSIQKQIDQLGQSIDQVASDTQFNGQNLLDGSFSTQIQSGANQGQTQNLAFADVSLNGLGLAGGGLDVTQPGNAANLLSALDSALNNVSQQQENAAGAQAGFNSRLSDLGQTYEHLASASSRQADTDYAQESTDFSTNKVKSQVSMHALALYNKNLSDSTSNLIASV